MIRSVAVAVAAAVLVVAGSAPAGAAPRHNFSFVVAPRSITVAKGKTGHFTITVSRGRDFTDPIGFDVQDLPKHVSAGFTPAGAGYDPHRTLIVRVGKHAHVGHYAPVLIARGGGKKHQRLLRIDVTR